MRQIKKGKEPREWQEHRSTPGATYDPEKGPGPTAETKQALREALVREQGYLCCYCMGRIRPTQDGMKIEHWAAQSMFPEHRMTYSNLLGACLGGEGSRPADQHCDTAKGNKALQIHPADPGKDCSALFGYASTGKIDGRADEARRDILTLNLNASRLVQARKAVLEGLLAWFRSHKNRGRSVSRSELLRKMRSHDDTSEELDPFCQVAIYWLTKHANQRA